MLWLLWVLVLLGIEGVVNVNLGAGFKYIPTWGNDQIWRAYFSAGLVQPPTRNGNRHLSRIQTCCDVKLL